MTSPQVCLGTGLELDDGDRLTWRPEASRAVLTTSAGTPVTNNAWLPIPFDTHVDQGGLTYDVANKWFYVTKPGVYLLAAAVSHTNHVSGHRDLQILVNGVAVARSMRDATAVGVDDLTVSTTKRLAFGDEVSVQSRQTSGVNLNWKVATAAAVLTWASVIYLGGDPTI